MPFRFHRALVTALAMLAVAQLPGYSMGGRLAALTRTKPPAFVSAHHAARGKAVRAKANSKKSTRVARNSKSKASNRVAQKVSKTGRKSNHNKSIAQAKHGKKRLAHASRHASKKIAAAKSGGHSNYMWSAPINLSKFDATTSNTIQMSFTDGQASKYSPEDLVRAGAVSYYGLKGGIRPRRGPIRNLILHSTETTQLADAKRVVDSWNSRGLVHPGAQYIVDRDGTIYETVDPSYTSSHVDTSRTLKGVTNANSIGIEIVRTGKQQYTAPQLESVVHLAGYLKDRFQIANIYGHGQIQPSDRTDPVNFDWSSFKQNLAMLKGNTRTAYGAHTTRQFSAVTSRAPARQRS